MRILSLLSRTALLTIATAAITTFAQAPAKDAKPAADAKPAPAAKAAAPAAAVPAAKAAAGNASVTFKMPPGFVVSGGRFFDSNSMTTDSSTYNLSLAVSPTINMGPPKDAPGQYNLAILQVNVTGSPTCKGEEDKVVACFAKRECGGLSEQCRPYGRWSVTNQGECNGGIKPDANNKIELSLTCDNTRFRYCECRVSAGTPTKTKAESVCPFTCQRYNPASKSCVGAPMNGC